MIAFHVKSKSFDVIGVPSDHSASGLILYVMVNGLWVIPPLSRVGASTSSGEASKLPWRFRTIAYGRTCSPTLYQYQVAEEQVVIGLMQSGHCSAPTTMFPPVFGAAVVAAGALLDELPCGVLLELLLHAAPTIEATAATVMARNSQRVRKVDPSLRASPPGR